LLKAKQVPKQCEKDGIELMSIDSHSQTESRHQDNVNKTESKMSMDSHSQTESRHQDNVNKTESKMSMDSHSLPKIKVGIKAM
jgi:hypothetical protein